MHSKHFLRFPSSVTDGKCLAGNKLSWYPVLLHLTIEFCTIQRRFTDDYLYQKLLILVQICWKYLRILQGSGFFETQCRIGPTHIFLGCEIFLGFSKKVSKLWALVLHGLHECI